MPKYYHIELLDIDERSNTILHKSGLKNDKLFYFDVKNGHFYSLLKSIVEDEIGLPMNDRKYNGYNVYEVTIPNNCITESLNPRSKKILNLTKSNFTEFKKLFNEFKKKNDMKNDTINFYKNWIKELQSRNIIGCLFFDIHINIANNRWAYEGYLYELINDITIKRVAKYRLID